jgi:hypothetical protein
MKLEFISPEELLRLNYKLCRYIQSPNVYGPHVTRVGRLIISRWSSYTLSEVTSFCHYFTSKVVPHYFEG